MGRLTMPLSQPTIGNAQHRLLEKLCNASAVSGDEGEVRKIVLEEVKPHADEVKVDAMGNVLVTRKGRTKNRPRVMLDAHMDEVGFILVSDEGDGLYRFETVGGIDPRHLPGKPVLVGKERHPGVIGIRPIHLVDAGEWKRKLTIDSLRIDLGPSGKAKPGEWAVFATKFKRVGPSIMAKAIDDRIGVATLIELLKHSPKNIDLLAAFTVQEEVGLRGAKVAAYALDPDLAIAIDSTPAYDMPKHDGSENAVYNTRLGYGPAIYVQNSSTIDDSRLVRFLKETAETESIPCQIRQPGGGGTDAGAIQRTRTGVPVVSVSVPGRYAHTPVGLCRVEDWRNTLKLLHATLERITPKILLEN
jgi:endoglucanase